MPNTPANADGALPLEWIREPKRTHVPETDAAVIRMHVLKSDMQAEMPKAIGEVLAALSAQGMEPAGPLYSKYYSVAGDSFDFEVGFPIQGRVQTAGRVEPSLRPGGDVYHATYVGSYENLGQAWGEFDAWVAMQAAPASQYLWEIYWSDPAQEPDPTKWRTGMYRAIER